MARRNSFEAGFRNKAGVFGLVKLTLEWRHHIPEASAGQCFLRGSEESHTLGNALRVQPSMLSMMFKFDDVDQNGLGDSEARLL
jgi:hypothetical protein